MQFGMWCMFIYIYSHGFLISGFYSTLGELADIWVMQGLLCMEPHLNWGTEVYSFFEEIFGAGWAFLRIFETDWLMVASMDSGQNQSWELTACQSLFGEFESGIALSQLGGHRKRVKNKCVRWIFLRSNLFVVYMFRCWGAWAELVGFSELRNGHPSSLCSSIWASALSLL